MKYIFILNPKAGRGKYKEILPNIEKACVRNNIPYELRYISDELNGALIASEYKDEECVNNNFKKIDKLCIEAVIRQNKY